METPADTLRNLQAVRGGNTESFSSPPWRSPSGSGGAPWVPFASWTSTWANLGHGRYMAVRDADRRGDYSTWGSSPGGIKDL